MVLRVATQDNVLISLQWGEAHIPWLWESKGTREVPSWGEYEYLFIFLFLQLAHNYIII